MIDTRDGLLRALAAGQVVRRGASGWRAGGAAIATELVEQVVADELASIEGAALLPTPAGRAAIAPTGGRRRILVERPIESSSTAPGGRPARSVTVNLAEPPLGWLRARGLVSERQFAAGEQLHADWTRAQLSPRVTMRWDPTPAAPRPGPPVAPGLTDTQRAARSRFDGAIAAAGAGLGDVLWRVACAGEALSGVERAFGWPGRSAKVVLGLALDRVADFFRLPGVKASLGMDGKDPETVGG